MRHPGAHFSSGVAEPGELNTIKFIAYKGNGFDHVLLAMVHEVAATYRVRAGRFLLHGFSDGGHFGHGFFYLKSRRLLGVSIDAPRVVTLLDADRVWRVGVRGLEERFGVALDAPGMSDVAVRMVIGGDDTETWEITIEPYHRLWLPGAPGSSTRRRRAPASSATASPCASTSCRALATRATCCSFRSRRSLPRCWTGVTGSWSDGVKGGVRVASPYHPLTHSPCHPARSLG